MLCVEFRDTERTRSELQWDVGLRCPLGKCITEKDGNVTQSQITLTLQSRGTISNWNLFPADIISSSKALRIKFELRKLKNMHIHVL